MAQAVWEGLQLDKHRAESASFWSNIDSFLELGAAVLRWPDSAEEAKDLLERTRWPNPPLPSSDSEIAASYGPLSGVLWTGLSAHNKTCLPSAPKSAQRKKCTVCGRRDQVASTDGQDKDKGIAWGVVPWEKIAEACRGVAQSAGGNPSPENAKEAHQLSLGEGLCAVCLTRRFAPQYFFGDNEKGQLGLGWADKEDRPFLRFPTDGSTPTFARVRAAPAASTSRHLAMTPLLSVLSSVCLTLKRTLTSASVARRVWARRCSSRTRRPVSGKQPLRTLDSLPVSDSATHRDPRLLTGKHQSVGGGRHLPCR